jgi:hypothetical protein
MAETTKGRSIRHERCLQGIGDEDLEGRPAAVGRVRGENQEVALEILKEDVEVGTRELPGSDFLESAFHVLG